MEADAAGFRVKVSGFRERRARKADAGVWGFIRMSKSVRRGSLRTLGGRLGDDFSMVAERALGSENLNRWFFGFF
jgi:hypothetical protein